MKTTIFVAITIAALGAVGITTSIMTSAIPVQAQSFSRSGHETLTGNAFTGGPSTHTFSGHIDAGPGQSGGGSISVTTSGSQVTVNKCVGSPGFKAFEGCPPK